MSQYECGFCGERYNTPQERMKCEEKCNAEFEKARAEAEKARLENEKEERKKQVDEAYMRYVELTNQFVKDYGSYVFYFGY